MAGVNREFIWEWRRDDAAFAAAFEAAMALSTETLEDEAIRRAFEGVPKPVFHKGRKVAEINEYSDRLLEVLLRARKPEQYGNRPTVVIPPPQQGNTGTPHTVLDAIRIAESNTQEMMALATRTVSTYAVQVSGDYKGSLVAAKTGQK
jgi:hypothetical protein